jgi:hypothetical protein
VACSNGEVRRLRAYNAVADVGWIGAAATGVTGLVLLFVLHDDPDAVRALSHVSPWVGANGAGLVLRGSL